MYHSTNTLVPSEPQRGVSLLVLDIHERPVSQNELHKLEVTFVSRNSQSRILELGTGEAFTSAPFEIRTFPTS